jgi:hypothetical protein
MHDELIDGTVLGWPCSAWITREPGLKEIRCHLCTYTDDDDNSAPIEVSRLCFDEIFPSRAAAIAALDKAGFVPAPAN